VTVAAGMISERDAREERNRKAVLEGVEFERSRLTPAERWERTGHRPVTIWLTARLDLAYLLERELFDRGCAVHVISDDVESHLMPDLARLSNAAGLITICSVASDIPTDRDRAEERIGADGFLTIDPAMLSSSDLTAVGQITKLLESRGFIRADDQGMDGGGI
jgi:adenylylsulfate kinase-like enzyme